MSHKLYIFQGAPLNSLPQLDVPMNISLSQDLDTALTLARNNMPGMHVIHRGCIELSEIVQEAKKQGYSFDIKKEEPRVIECKREHTEPIRDLEAMAAYMRDNGYTVRKKAPTA